MRTLNPKKQKGFGMTDAIIASGLVGASIVSLGDLAGDYNKELRTANTRTEAIAHAEQKVENFRSLVDKEEFEEFVVDSESAETKSARSTEFNRSWQVTNQTELYRQASVTVAWADGKDENKVVLKTLFFAEDPFEAGRKLMTLASTTVGNLGSIGITDLDGDGLTDINNNYGDGDGSDTEGGPGDIDGDNSVLPSYSITLSGKVDEKKYFDYRKGVSVSGSYGGMCVNEKDSYSCTLGPIEGGESWSGTLSIPAKKNGVICTATSLTGLTENTELDVMIRKKSKYC
ncbi:MAG: hypothetical protein ABJK20_14840 [Halieaceae bacterium]